MPKATISQFIAATRTVLVPLTFEVEGERQTEDFKVVYKAFSPKVAAEMAALEDDKTDSLPAILAGIVVSIPEIADGDNPMTITAETLQQMSTDNLLSIYRKVLSDVSPTKAPATSNVSPSTSATEPAPQS